MSTKTLTRGERRADLPECASCCRLGAGGMCLLYRSVAIVAKSPALRPQGGKCKGWSQGWREK